MEDRPHLEQGYRSCLGILRLSSTYGPQRMEAACARALAMHSYSHRSLASILNHGLDAKPLPGETQERSHPHHENVRGGDYYTGKDNEPCCTPRHWRDLIGSGFSGDSVP
jgi:transposase